jgi:hypothetical protein
MSARAGRTVAGTPGSEDNNHYLVERIWVDGWCVEAVKGR